MLPTLVHKIFTFYINGVLNCKCPAPGPKGYIMEVICYIRKHHQFVALNSNIHAHNTLRKMGIHIQSYNTDLYKRSVINMGTKLYNKLPGYIKK